MGGDGSGGGQEMVGDEIAIIARAIRAQFGADAWLVAKRQIEEADPQIRATWEAILALLSA